MQAKIDDYKYMNLNIQVKAWQLIVPHAYAPMNFNMYIWNRIL